MFQLKNTCKGWAGMQAAIKKKKTVYHTIQIKIEGKPGNYYELVQALSVNDPKLTPMEIEGIKNFNKNDKENYRTPSGEVAWNALNIFIRQRLMKFPETGRSDSDAYERIYFSEYNIYIDDEKIGEIKHKKSVSFDLEYGEHTIYFNLQGKMQSKYKSIKKTFVLSSEKPTVNIKCRIWGYGLLFTSLFITNNHIIVTID